VNLSAAIAAFMAGNNAGCLAILDRLAPSEQMQSPALAIQGIALARLGRHHEAIPRFRRLTQVEPREMAHPINLAMSLRAVGDVDDALRTLVDALAHEAGNVSARVLLAQLHADRGDHRLALGHLAVISDVAQTDESLLLAGQIQFELGDESAAAAALDRALKIGLGDVEAINSAGVLANLLGRLDTAEQLFTEAIGMIPVHGVAVANLACQYERTNRLHEAGSLLERFRDLHGPELDLARARVMSRRDGRSAAIEIYRRLMGDPNTTPILRHNISFDLGKLLDKAGQFSDAMAAFQDGHDIAIDLLRRNHPDLLLPQSAEDWDASTEGGAEFDWPSTMVPRQSSHPAPIFVIGFPRSGTTLIEQVLAAHPRLDSLDEILAIDRAIHELQLLGNHYPESLNTLTDAALERAEAAYWHEVGKHHQLNPASRIVDKYPFNLVRLPMIRRLFPDAKIIMMLRHPLDCVLSCYMQKFRLNKGTSMWATLESTAELYRRAMGAYLRHKSVLGVNTLEIKYETLVSDFERSVADVLAFIDEPWHPAVMQFDKAAAMRGRISTPSYAQVAQPVYAQAVGRWKSYEQHLRKAAAIVEPLIEHFGYDLPAARSDTQFGQL